MRIDGVLHSGTTVSWQYDPVLDRASELGPPLVSGPALLICPLCLRSFDGGREELREHIRFRHGLPAPDCLYYKRPAKRAAPTVLDLVELPPYRGGKKNKTE